MSSPLVSVPFPEKGKDFLRMVSVKAGTVEKAYSYSSFVVGWHMHWVNNRTELCVKPMMECAWHAARIPTRWYGFLYGYSVTWGCPCLIQLTEQAVRSCLRLQDPAVNLRGAYVELSRPAQPRNAAVHVRLELDRKPRGLPSEEPDTLRHLQRFYRLDMPLEGRTSIDPARDE